MLGYSISKFVKVWKCSHLTEDVCDAASSQGKQTLVCMGNIAGNPPPPSNMWFKLNFDGFKLENGQASFGFTIRNHLGDFCLLGAMTLSSDCFIVKAEA